MKTLLSFNVNGLRSVLKKDFLVWLEKVNPDVIMLQEIKAEKDQLDFDLFESKGYHLEISSAEKKGYSGVAVLSKEKPNEISHGIGVEKFDIEGRNLLVSFDQFAVCSVYMPSGASSPARQAFKMEWLDAYKNYLLHIKTMHPNLVIAGDFNICHQAKDIHNPVRLKGVPGFTEPERVWMDDLINTGFVDAFRQFNQDPQHYTWWSYMARARERNIGWRIDYQFYSNALAEKLTRAVHLSDVKMSDHCPVLTQLDL